MKNLIKIVTLILMTTAFFACSPQDNDNNTLGQVGTVANEEVNYQKTMSLESNNVFEFTNTTDVKSIYSLMWDFGNGQTSKNHKATAKYPFAGEYTVTLNIYSPDGFVAKKSEVLVIAENDYDLINTPVYKKLTGGLDNPEGVTWVIDQYNNFSKEVAKETGYDIKGHLGLGKTGSYTQEHWAASANDKKEWSLYSHKFNFKLIDLKLNIKNDKGVGYGRKASAASVGGFTVLEEMSEDVSFNFTGGDYVYSIDESTKNPTLSLSGNAFMGYYCGTQEYEIFYQTEDVFAVRINNSKEGHDWIMVFCREELNVGKQPKEVVLKEDFENKELAIVFEQKDLGDKSMVVDNPTPYGPVNQSAKVYRYERTDKPNGSLSYVTPDYKFDLTNQNKIKMKVFIPSYNVLGTLLLKVEVKLQNSDEIDPIATQTKKEKVLTTADLDKWIEIEFDFSDAAAIKNYDKIVIEFGGADHSEKGIFYFDDFELVK